jgi:hypothetical protein
MSLLWVKGWCIAVVPNLWYAAERLRVRENNIGNGRKHQTDKQSYEVLAYKLPLDPPSHIIILMMFLFVLILC